jgi:hypothetical protein
MILVKQEVLILAFVANVIEMRPIEWIAVLKEKVGVNLYFAISCDWGYVGEAFVCAPISASYYYFPEVRGDIDDFIDSSVVEGLGAIELEVIEAVARLVYLLVGRGNCRTQDIVPESGGTVTLRDSRLYPADVPIGGIGIGDPVERHAFLDRQEGRWRPYARFAAIAAISGVTRT